VNGKRERDSLPRAFARRDTRKPAESKGVLRGILYLAAAVGIGIAFGLCARAAGAVGGAGGVAASTVGEAGPTPDPGGNDADYIAEIEAWRARRVESFRKETGWLSLAGLFPLKPGENRFGTDPANEIVFPKGSAPPLVGRLIVGVDGVKVRIEPGVAVHSDARPVRERALRSDAEGDPTVLELGTLSWYVIERGDRRLVRLKDRANPAIAAFRGIDAWPVDPAWRIPARFEPYDPSRKVRVASIIGTVVEEASPGALVFMIDGREYRLDPLAEPEDERFFIMFADATTGKETYGAGRYLAVDRPGPDGTTTVDFNRAYNPPCAFTGFATCPLPPPQNRLSIRVTAGEKAYRGGGAH